jgi:hypothetical protein
MFQIKEGRVRALDAKGVYIKVIGEASATDARFQADKITIQYTNGKMKLYDKNGVYIRTL